MKGGAALVETLAAHGVDTGFTVPGESFLPVLEALRLRRNSFRLVTVRHESGGSFAADAFGKLTRRPAAVFVSRGPGATNASIGVHTAMQDSTPMVMMVGHVRTRSKGRESFQEVDHHRMFGALAKAVIEPATAADVAECTARACRLSVSGRPGPVILVLPRDVGDGDAGDEPIAAGVARPAVGPDAGTIATAAELIAAAERPVMLVGELAGAPETRAALEDLAERGAIPVMAGYRCQDRFDNLHPAYAGHLEINRVGWQSRALDEADLVIAVGTRMEAITSEEYTLPRRHQKLVMIHPDSDVLARFAADAAIAADCAPAVLALAAALSPAASLRQARVAALHKAYLELSEPGGVAVQGRVDLAAVTAELQRQVPADATLVTDAGSYARWIHRYYRFRHPWTQAGAIVGAMGYAVPGGIGGHLARPGRPTVAFVGDGGFMMTGQELATAVEQAIPLKVIVCDNAAHGSILEGQRKAYGMDQLYATQLRSPDFAMVARGYGAAGWTVTETGEFPDALAAALKEPGPALLHLKTDIRDVVPFTPEVGDKV